MAKDPAFLFYPGDWNLGTMHLTLLEKGCYMELLILQFAKGKFTEAQAKHMLNGSFDLAWPTIREKFCTDGTFFWNKRLKLEKEKREKFSESRRNNGSIKKNEEKSPKHMPKHMEDENINENINELKYNNAPTEKFLIPEMFDLFKKSIPSYPGFVDKDFKPLQSISSFIHEQSKLNGNAVENKAIIIKKWEQLCTTISMDNFYKTKSLSVISNQIQEIFQIQQNGRSDKQQVAGNKFTTGQEKLLARGKQVFADITGKPSN